jgi:hypothetical protein
MKTTAIFLTALLVSLTSLAGGAGTSPSGRNGFQGGSRIFSCDYRAYEKVNGRWEKRTSFTSYGKSSFDACGSAEQRCEEYGEKLSQTTGNQYGCLIDGASPQLLDGN